MKGLDMNIKYGIIITWSGLLFSMEKEIPSVGFWTAWHSNEVKEQQEIGQQNQAIKTLTVNLEEARCAQKGSEAYAHALKELYAQVVEENKKNAEAWFRLSREMRNFKTADLFAETIDLIKQADAFNPHKPDNYYDLLVNLIKREGEIALSIVLAQKSIAQQKKELPKGESEKQSSSPEVQARKDFDISAIRKLRQSVEIHAEQKTNESAKVMVIQAFEDQIQKGQDDLNAIWEAIERLKGKNNSSILATT